MDGVLVYKNYNYFHFILTMNSLKATLNKNKHKIKAMLLKTHNKCVNITQIEFKNWIYKWFAI